MKIFKRDNFKLFHILIMILVLFIPSIILADTNHDKIEVSDLFKDFTSDRLENIENFSLYDNQQNDVTEKYIEIDEIISENNLTSAYTERKILGPIAMAQEIPFSESKTYRVRAKSKGFTREWLVRLGGTFMYNPNTGVIGKVSGPTLTLEYTSLSATTSAELANVSTGYTKFSSKVEYHCKYKMLMSRNEFGYWDDVDFGWFNHSFYSYPE